MSDPARTAARALPFARYFAGPSLSTMEVSSDAPLPPLDPPAGWAEVGRLRFRLTRLLSRLVYGPPAYAVDETFPRGDVP